MRGVPHDHTTVVEGCVRCDLSADEEREVSTTRCACDGMGQGVHKRRCSNLTDRELFVDIDIRPLPMCERCYVECWIAGFDALRSEK